MQNLQPFHTFSLPAKAKKIIEIHLYSGIATGLARLLSGAGCQCFF